jgi:hypothetical protein
MQVRVSTQRLREEAYGYQIRHFRFANGTVKRMLQELNDLSMTGVDDTKTARLLLIGVR